MPRTTVIQQFAGCVKCKHNRYVHLFPATWLEPPFRQSPDGDLIYVWKSARLKNRKICGVAGFQIDVQSNDNDALVMQVTIFNRIARPWREDDVAEPRCSSTVALNDITNPFCVYCA